MSENDEDDYADDDDDAPVPKPAKQGGARPSKIRRHGLEPELEVPPVAVLVSYRGGSWQQYTAVCPSSHAQQ